MFQKCVTFKWAMSSQHPNTAIRCRDIRIGLVSDVREQPGSLFKSITIEPGVDFVKLETMFVLVYIQDKERAELEQRTASRSGK